MNIIVLNFIADLIKINKICLLIHLAVLSLFLQIDFLIKSHAIFCTAVIWFFNTQEHLNYSEILPLLLNLFAVYISVKMFFH